MTNKKIKIKICGMKNPGNVAEIVNLKPDYLGFILYKGSKRYTSFNDAARLVRNVPPTIRKVAVLVNEPLENAIKIGQSSVFDLLQLHGKEEPDYCRVLYNYTSLIKAFSVNNKLPGNIEDYEPYCNMFLFDTAGKTIGGTGCMFDHSLLADYNLDKEFILSGGISPSDVNYIRSLNAGKMAAVDLNSRFEIKPGLKDPVLLKQFITNIRKDEDNN